MIEYKFNFQKKKEDRYFFMKKGLDSNEMKS